MRADRQIDKQTDRHANRNISSIYLGEVKINFMEHNVRYFKLAIPVSFSAHAKQRPSCGPIVLNG